MHNKYFLMILWLLLFLLGSNISIAESPIFYLGSLLLWIANYKKIIKIPKVFALYLVLSIPLEILSVIFSGSISISYYAFFTKLFIYGNIILLTNCLNFDLQKDKRIIQSFGFIFSLVFLLKTFALPSSGINLESDNPLAIFFGHSKVSDFLLLLGPLLASSNIFYFFGPIFILTQNRASILGLAVIFIFLYLKKQIQLNLRLALLIGAFLAINIYIVLRTPEYKSPSGARLDYWTQAIKSFNESPLIGNGQNTFYISNQKYSSLGTLPTNDPHSYFFKLLSDNGLILTLFSFLTIFYLLKKQKEKTEKSVTIGIFFTSLISTILNNIFMHITFWFLLLKDQVAVTLPSKIKVLFLVILSIFSITKISGDIAYLLGKYNLVDKLDWFNTNGLMLTDINNPKLALLNKNDLNYYQKLLAFNTKNNNSVMEICQKILTLSPSSQLCIQKIVDISVANNDQNNLEAIGKHVIKTLEYEPARPILTNLIYHINPQRQPNLISHVTMLYPTEGLKYYEETVALDFNPYSAATTEMLNFFKLKKISSTVIRDTIYSRLNKATDPALFQRLNEIGVIISPGDSIFYTNLFEIYKQTDKEKARGIILDCMKYPDSASACAHRLQFL